MNAMTLAGRRAEIVWGKLGRRYDSYLVNFGLFVPFSLGERVHVWDIPLTVFGSAKGVKLRPDDKLKNSVLRADWALIGGIAVLIGCPFIWSQPIVSKLGWTITSIIGVATFILAATLLVISRVVIIKVEPREKEIRHVLGPHGFGSSDPGTWHESICKDVVDPSETFELKTYAALAKKAIGEEDWCTAMWAARLCVAVESAETGEQLTDVILESEDVRDRLLRVQRRPQEHEHEFGTAPALEDLLKYDPAEYIIKIG